MGHQKDKTRTEDLSTDQRANRHPNKTGNYTEDAQNVMDDNVGDVSPIKEENLDHSRNKATEGIRQGRDKGNNNS